MAILEGERKLIRDLSSRFNQPDAENVMCNDAVVEVPGDDGQELEQPMMATRELSVLAPLRVDETDSSFNRLLQEQLQAGDLEAAFLGHVMLRRREMLREMLQHTAQRHPKIAPQGLGRPLWLDVLEEAVLKLMTNIDVYIFRIRLQVAVEDYARRHQEIVSFVEDHSSPEMLRTYPDLFEILTMYMSIAPRRLEEERQ